MAVPSAAGGVLLGARSCRRRGRTLCPARAGASAANASESLACFPARAPLSCDMKFQREKMDFLSLLLLFFSAVAVSRAQVLQEPSADTSEGTGINITCSHPSIQADIIHWYRQLPGRGPAFLVSAVKGSKVVPDPVGRLLVSEDRRSSTLWLAGPRLWDSAVYYCALAARGEEPGLRPSTNRFGRPGCTVPSEPAGGAACRANKLHSDPVFSREK